MDPLLSLIIALVFAAAYVHVRVRSRRRPRGWLARLILAGGVCIWLLYVIYELSIQHEFKPENVPIRLDLLLLRPFLVAVLILGVIAYLYGLRSPGSGSAPHEASVSQAETGATPRDTRSAMDQAHEKLAHLLSKPKNEEKN
jgi:lysylphosphatidylglycerol synthetase-like protein (DUF2156 family)